MGNKVDFLSSVSHEVMAGITVSLALVPISVAFAIMSGVPPIHGLYCSVIVGFIAALTGGRPGMITAATGALAVVMVAIVQKHGIEYLFAATVLTGAIQVVAGITHLGKFIRLVPKAAIYGFVNGLAIVIFLSQVDYFKTEGLDGELLWLGGGELARMLGLVGLTMFIIHFFPKLTKAVPASLVAVVFVTLLVMVLGLDAPTVGDKANITGELPTFHIPMVPLTLETLLIVLPYAFILAAIGLIESLITLSLVDDYTHTHGRGNMECIGQGLGNFTAGLFGGFAGCATVGPTIINLSSGGRGRLSGMTAAATILCFILFAGPLIEIVPLAALIGLMFMVVIATFAWSTFDIIRKIPKTDAFVIFAVTVVTVVEDLAVAVFIGVIISALAFAWENAKNISVRVFISKDGTKTYKIYGPLFFGSISGFNAFFDTETDPKEVVIDFKRSRVCDHSAIEAIDALAEKYIKKETNLHLIHLSPECKQLLAKASDYVEEDKAEDPVYSIMSDKLD